jgi:hypothetical protein
MSRTLEFSIRYTLRDVPEYASDEDVFEMIEEHFGETLMDHENPLSGREIDEQVEFEEIHEFNWVREAE